MAELPVLDARCEHRECRAGAEYRLQATCRNCGSVAVLRLTKEHERPTLGGPKCPVCQCKCWGGWTVPHPYGRAAREALRGRHCLLLFASSGCVGRNGAGAA